MSRPPARPLQRTPRAPLLAPSTPPTASAADVQAPERAEATAAPDQTSAGVAEPASSTTSAGAGEEKFLSTRVPKALHRRVRQASIDLDMPIREVIVSAVTEWLDRHDRT